MGFEVQIDGLLGRVIREVLRDYDMEYGELVAPGKGRGPSEARSVILWLIVQLGQGYMPAEVTRALHREHGLLRAGMARLERDMVRQPSLRRRAERLLRAVAGSPQEVASA